MPIKKVYNKILLLPWVVWACVYTLEIWLINSVAPGSLGWSPSDSGTFGDMFGAANSLFSAFAVIGVTWSVSMQRTELSIAREDRDKTKKIIKDQQENIKIQRFETTFFQLFSAFQSIVDNMEVDTGNGGTTKIQLTERVERNKERPSTARGQQAFNKILQVLEKEFRIEQHWHQGKDPDGLESGDDFGEEINSRNLDAFGRAYEKIFAVYGSDLGRYFRSLYIILDFINRAEIKNNYFYSKLIRAQLSQQESTLLALNYLTNYTTKEFNSLKLAYGMAKNADKTNGVLHNFIYQLPPELFGRSYTRKRTKKSKLQ